MRVFYAIKLPPLIQEHCLKIIKELHHQHSLKDFRWTLPENLHITLRFLENIEEVKLNNINSLLQDELPKYQSFTLSTRRIVLFPSKKPHIIALAIHLNTELANLVKIINDDLLSEGIMLEKRPFVPHITLGRFRESVHTEDFHFNAINTVEDAATRVVLFKSESNDSGSHYIPLKTFELEKG